MQLCGDKDEAGRGRDQHGAIQPDGSAVREVAHRALEVRGHASVGDLDGAALDHVQQLTVLFAIAAGPTQAGRSGAMQSRISPLIER